MKGADIIVYCLELEGVEVVFAYPGGASIELHQSLINSSQIRTILPRFEQGCGFMAHGYSRVTGKPGVCIATSGPGATNLITCIADAYIDSIPLVIITGQVFQDLIGKNAFQEVDVLGITLPIIKYSFLVLKVEDLQVIVKKAFKIAISNRPGPVLIDIPKDIQQINLVNNFKNILFFKSPYYKCPLASDIELENILCLIARSKRPVLYIGGGIISSGASTVLHRLASITGIPVASTLMCIGSYPTLKKQSLYWFGMHGTVAGNLAVYHSDLLIALGARFDDRVTGFIDEFAQEAIIVHLDINQSEFNKSKFAHYTIFSEVKFALKRIIKLIYTSKYFKKPDLSNWMISIKYWKQKHSFPFLFKNHKDDEIIIFPQEIISVLYKATKGKAIITTGVGQHQMWTPQFYYFNKPRHYISSLGLGTMGFGLPTALGAKVAFPNKVVIDVDGDGSFQMNIQELATAKIEKIPVKILLLNNQHLGMVMQWEDHFYGSRRANTILCDPNYIGSYNRIYPDFVKIANGYGIAANSVKIRKYLKESIDKMLAYDGPYVLDVIVSQKEHVLPFIPQNKSAKIFLQNN